MVEGEFSEVEDAMTDSVAVFIAVGVLQSHSAVTLALPWPDPSARIGRPCKQFGSFSRSDPPGLNQKIQRNKCKKRNLFITLHWGFGSASIEIARAKTHAVVAKAVGTIPVMAHCGYGWHPLHEVGAVGGAGAGTIPHSKHVSEAVHDIPLAITMVSESQKSWSPPEPT